MKILLLLCVVTLLTCIVYGSPAKGLYQRTDGVDISTRFRRSDPHYVKSGRMPLNVAKPYQGRQGLRKGEYICGHRVCQLKPGENTPACPNCQIPI